MNKFNKQWICFFSQSCLLCCIGCFWSVWNPKDNVVMDLGVQSKAR